MYNFPGVVDGRWEDVYRDSLRSIPVTIPLLICRFPERVPQLSITLSSNSGIRLRGGAGTLPSG